MIKITVWFVVITLIITALLAVFQEKIELDFEVMALPQFAPALGYLLIRLFFQKARIPIGLDFNNKALVIKSLWALSIPLLLISMSYFIGKIVGVEVLLTLDLRPLLSIMAGGVLAGAIGEELGWRSFLQPFLEKSISPLLASMLVGTIWGLWHIGHFKNGLLFMLGFLLFTISASILIAWNLRNTRFILLLSVLFHVSINIGFFVYFQYSINDQYLMVINGIVWMIPAILIVVLNGKNLTRTSKQT